MLTFTSVSNKADSIIIYALEHLNTMADYFIY